MQTSPFFAISAMDVEHIDTYTPGTVVNFKRSEGTVVLAKILDPSEHGAEYRSITYERSGSMVTHNCAPIAQMSQAAKPGPKKSAAKPAAKPAAKVAAKPSPSLWPLLSMCSSSKTSTLTKESGTQSLCFSGPKHACQQAFSRSSSGSYALLFACLAVCRASLAQ